MRAAVGARAAVVAAAYARSAARGLAEAGAAVIASAPVAAGAPADSRSAGSGRCRGEPGHLRSAFAWFGLGDSVCSAKKRREEAREGREDDRLRGRHRDARDLLVRIGGASRGAST
jgi:hypothetical protein